MNHSDRRVAGQSRHRHLLRRMLLGGSLFACSAAAAPLQEAVQALQGGKPEAAIRILEQAADAGDVAAKGQLASYLRNFPPPYRDIERACKLAIEAADGGDSTGMVTRSECLLSGAEKSFHRYSQARYFARQAWKAGNPSGGFMLYLVYSQDPQYRYSENGKVNPGRYATLAATPLAERTEQIEALDALSDAIRAGHVHAVIMGLAHLNDAVAPGNLERMLNLVQLLQLNGEKLPALVTPSLQIAAEIRRLGDSHVSPALFRSAYPSLQMAAAMQLQRIDNTPCDAGQVRLRRLEAGPLDNAQYLPNTRQPFRESYLLQGSWNEIWTFEGCGKSVPLKVSFSADGWSGARFTVAVEPGK